MAFNAPHHNYIVDTRQAAVRAGIDPGIFTRQIKQESGFNPNARSGAGALGIAQIMPGTARGWGVDPMDPQAALNAAAGAMAKYVRSYGGDYRKALAAYNAGPGNVAKYHGVPPFKETQNYVQRIMAGGPGSSNTGSPAMSPTVASPAMSAPAPAADGRKAMALSLIFGDDPVMSAILSAGQQNAAPAPSVVAQVKTSAPAKGAIGKDYRWIQQQGEKLFGLRNDPGDSQLTGGHHTNGSEHYSGRAVDFGNARNSPSQLKAWQKWARAQGLDVLDEGDHIHVSLPGRGI